MYCSLSPQTRLPALVLKSWWKVLSWWPEASAQEGTRSPDFLPTPLCYSMYLLCVNFPQPDASHGSELLNNK